MNKLFLILLLFPVLANAADTAKVSWTAPTQDTNNKPLTGPTAIVKYQVFHDTKPITASTTIQPVEVTAPTTSHTFTLAGGESGQLYYFRVKACHSTLCSAFSSEATKFIAADIVAPLPPGDLTVSDTTAYTVVKQRDKFVMLPVGTVPNGTKCISDQTVNGFYVVPRVTVTWSGTVKPEVVVALCAS
jgi:hypothetical protein